MIKIDDASRDEFRHNFWFSVRSDAIRSRSAAVSVGLRLLARPEYWIIFSFSESTARRSHMNPDPVDLTRFELTKKTLTIKTTSIYFPPRAVSHSDSGSIRSNKRFSRANSKTNLPLHKCDGFSPGGLDREVYQLDYSNISRSRTCHDLHNGVRTNRNVEHYRDDH